MSMEKFHPTDVLLPSLINPISTIFQGLGVGHVQGARLEVPSWSSPMGAWLSFYLREQGPTSRVLLEPIRGMVYRQREETD